MRGEAEVKAFSRAMLEKLRQREHHGDWRQMPLKTLFEWLLREVAELEDELPVGDFPVGSDPCDLTQTLSEAADVANLAMMIADRCGALTKGPELPSALDIQEGGDHYKKMQIQPIEFSMRNRLGFGEGNVVKYVTRWREKGGINDLKKARHYLDVMIELYGEAKP